MVVQKWGCIFCCCCFFFAATISTSVQASPGWPSLLVWHTHKPRQTMWLWPTFFSFVIYMRMTFMECLLRVLHTSVASVLSMLHWSALAPRTTILLLSIQPDPVPPPPRPLALLCTPDQLVSCTHKNKQKSTRQLVIQWFQINIVHPFCLQPSLQLSLSAQ